MHKLKPIKTEEEYDLALKHMEEIFHAEEGSEEGDEAEVLMLIIEDYEEKYHSIGHPDPIEAIKIINDSQAT